MDRDFEHYLLILWFFRKFGGKKTSFLGRRLHDRKAHASFAARN